MYQTKPTTLLKPTMLTKMMLLLCSLLFSLLQFPLPLPRGGRYANDPILREDQLAGVGRKKGIGAVSQKRRNKIIEYLNAPEFRFEDNFVSGSSNSGRRPHGNTLWNGYGRKNPNEVRANGKARRKRV
eukprot:GEZU01014601.1.p3 GENE.GEZU01014601.1~~GEZU01014601.1.p3  ORF type:complete len:128 (+),score=30.51 GEZU01014601.1:460-843(+)